MTKKALIFLFFFFIQYFIGHQSNMLAKGIKFYVGVDSSTKCEFTQSFC